MNTLLIDLLSILETATIGTIGTDLFGSKEPDAPDNCVTIYNTGGVANDAIDLTDDSERNFFQVRIRNTNYEDAWDVMDAVNVLFKKKQFAIVGSTRYTFNQQGLPVDLLRDTRNRVIVVGNFQCLRSSQ